MRKLMLLVALVAGLNLVASAQITRKSPEKRAAHITKMLQKKLNLNADQAGKVNAAFFVQATRMDSLKSNRSADKKANHLAARSIMLSTEQSVVAVLDDTQKQQFMAWVKMRKEKHMRHKDAMEQKS